AEALTFAARRLPDQPIRSLLARRSGAASALERALDPVGVERLEVGPLSLGAIRLLLSERLGLVLPRRILRQVSEASRGNPLFALEFGRVLIERGIPPIGEDMPVPQMVEDLFGPRVVGLRPRARRLRLGFALSS